jgi:hypothetical protein
VPSKVIAVPEADHMGQSALRVLMRHHPHDSFRVLDRDDRALAQAASLDPQVLDHVNALETFTALARDDHALGEGIIATAPAAHAGGA